MFQIQMMRMSAIFFYLFIAVDDGDDTVLVFRRKQKKTKFKIFIYMNVNGCLWHRKFEQL